MKKLNVLTVWICYNNLIQSLPMHPFSTPENIRKPVGKSLSQCSVHSFSVTFSPSLGACCIDINIAILSYLW